MASKQLPVSQPRNIVPFIAFHVLQCLVYAFFCVMPTAA